MCEPGPEQSPTIEFPPVCAQWSYDYRSILVGCRYAKQDLLIRHSDLEGIDEVHVHEWRNVKWLSGRLPDGIVGLLHRNHIGVALAESIVDFVDDCLQSPRMILAEVEGKGIEAVTNEIKKANEVVLIENNVTGLIGQIIREQTGQLIEKKILKYDARPFTSEEVVTSVKGLLKWKFKI